MNRIIKTATIAAMVIAINACKSNNKVEDKVEEQKITGIELQNMDTTIKPGVDFFAYANGGWLKANPMGEEFSRYGAFEVLEKMNNERIKTLIEEISAKKDLKKGSIEQKIGDFYKSAMDTNAINSKGFDPIKPILAKVDALKSVNEIPALHAELNYKGIYPLFYFYSAQDEKNSTRIIGNMHQGGLGLPDRDYYTEKNPRFDELRAKYVQHIVNMFKLTGLDEAQSLSAAKKVMDIETKLAKASMTMKERRDPKALYNLTPMTDFVKSSAGYDFKSYFNGLGLSDLAEVNVNQSKFFKALGAMQKSIKLDDWKIYLKWHILNGTATMLSSNFEKEHFDFYSKILSGVQKQKERWETAVKSTNGNLGDAVGKIYVDKFFPAEAKKRMTELVSNLKIALNASIKNLDWMSPETKSKAVEKLEAMNVKIGYPNVWKDFSSVEITATNFIQNSWNCDAFYLKYELDKIGKPVNREEWGMTPQTVNAYYSPNMNEIVFPAAILQPPFFDMNADDAVNYGAIGVVIGHEMTHGFDDQGRLYDKDGNLNDWWTEEDAIKFKEKTQILVDQFNNFVMLDSMHVDGELTLGENIADNGGLFVAHEALLMAYKKNGNPQPIDGLNFDQRFCISYAQVWRQHMRNEELMRRLKEDVHSPGYARVNAGLRNAPWWYDAFKIAEGDPNYIAPGNRAKIW